MAHHSDPFATANQTAHEWLSTIANHLGTDDRQYAYRLLRTWLHLVRDRLTIDSAAHFAAQLPEILRGVYYDGWVPSKAPDLYDSGWFAKLFADDAKISLAEVPATAGAITAALTSLCSPGQLDHVFVLLPANLRRELQGNTTNH